MVIPENDTAVIAGRRFIAGTMWLRPDPTTRATNNLIRPSATGFSRDVNVPCLLLVLAPTYEVPSCSAGFPARPRRKRRRDVLQRQWRTGFARASGGS